MCVSEENKMDDGREKGDKQIALVGEGVEAWTGTAVCGIAFDVGVVFVEEGIDWLCEGCLRVEDAFEEVGECEVHRDGLLVAVFFVQNGRYTMLFKTTQITVNRRTRRSE